MPATLRRTFFKTYFSILSIGLIIFLPAQMPAIKAAGEIDPSFNAGAFKEPRGSATTTVAQPDGKILIGGSFEVASGALRYSLVRVNTDGSVDTSFNPPPLTDNSGSSSVPGIVEAIALQPDGKIIVAGSFRIPGLNFEAPIARLNADGSLDTSFNPPGSANDTVYDIALQTDGKILLSGEFSPVDGMDRAGIVRLNADGSPDTSFNAMADSSVFAVELQPDGKILVGGAFTGIGGAPRNRIARLNPNGSIDTTFNVGAGADGNVNSLALDASGRVLAGGEFVRYDNTPRVGLVRLLNDTAAP